MSEWRIIQGDCLEVMRGMEAGSVDAVVTDPPYGISQFAHKAKSKNKLAMRGDYGDCEWDRAAPSPEYIAELFRVGKAQIIWGMNYLGLRGGALVWDKNSTWFSEAEIAYCSKITGVRMFRWTWNGMIQQDMKHKEKRVHPTQKPEALMKWCIENYTAPGDTILDPFMGSGTTGVACVKLGRNFIGIEISADYCAIAERRLRDAAAQPALLEPAP